MWVAQLGPLPQPPMPETRDLFRWVLLAGKGPLHPSPEPQMSPVLPSQGESLISNRRNQTALGESSVLEWNLGLARCAVGGTRQLSRLQSYDKSSTWQPTSVTYILICAIRLVLMRHLRDKRIMPAAQAVVKVQSN